jgi:ribosomal protein L32
MPATDEKTRSTYKVRGVHCLNCGWNEERGREVEIPKGVPIPAHTCPECGCQKLWKDK